MMYILLAIIGSVFASVGSLYLKFISIAFKDIKGLIRNYQIYLGIGFYGISTILGLAAFRGGDLSVIYPIFALSYIWTVLLSIKFLKEQMNIWKWVGVVTIVVGVGFVAMG